MTKKWPYALVALGGFALGGFTCGSGGYLAGYYFSEPEIMRLDLQKDDLEGLCVYKNRKELVCAADVNYDGAVDYVVIDVETQAVKNVEYGQDDCNSKFVRLLKEEMEKQQGQE